MKEGIENSWAPHPGFEPPPSAQQAGALPLDHSAAWGAVKLDHCIPPCAPWPDGKLQGTVFKCNNTRISQMLGMSVC